VNVCGGKYNERSSVIKKTMTLMASVRLDGAVEPVRVKMTNMIRHFESNEKEVDFIGFKVMKEDLPKPLITCIMEEVFKSDGLHDARLRCNLRRRRYLLLSWNHGDGLLGLLVFNKATRQQKGSCGGNSGVEREMG
jgi:hypothetical protein